MADQTTWNEALYSLDDESFLEIMRNYLGPIRTPFNKPDLISQLTRFITGERVRKRILSLINRQERALLNAVYFLDRPSVDDIYRFFDRKIQFYIVQQQIINLEERLLLLQRRDRSLMINPLFLDDLIGSQVHISHIMSISDAGSEQAESDGQVTIMDQPLFISYFSLFYGNYIRITQDGTLKRSTGRVLEDVFPHMSAELIGSLTHLFIRSFTSMGILSSSNGSINCSAAAVKEHLESSSWPEFVFRFLVGCYAPVYSDLDDHQVYSFLYELLTILEQVGSLRAKSLQRLWMIQASHHGLPMHEMHEPILILKTLGILTYADGFYRLHPDLSALLSGGSSPNTSCIIDSDYTITCGRDFSLHSSRFLYLCTRIRKTDTSFLFEITKNSIVQAFDAGFTADEITSLLEEVSSNPVPGNIIQTIRHWSAEYESIQIYSGIVIAADAQRSRIIEKHPSLQDHIIRKFCEGVFLLRSETETVWREILNQSGVEVLPKTKFADPENGGESIRHAIGYRLPDTITRDRFSEAAITEDIRHIEHDEAFKAELQEALAQKKIPRKAFEDLTARIEKGLILIPEQLVSTYLHPTVQEAHGFDFQGKVNLCRQAMDSGKDLLEIHVKSFTEKEDILLIQPTELKKQGNEVILIGLEVPENHHFEKSLRKIFLLRKLKSSLYSPISPSVDT